MVMVREGVILEVKSLKTEFHTEDGVVQAVNGVSFEVRQGEVLGIVGESGCGKSVTALSLLRLVPQPAGRIVGGEVIFQGRDLFLADEEEMRQVRGKKIAMIFQDPMTSLNPVLTVGQQISEALMLHLEVSKEEARVRTIRLLEMVGIPEAEERVDDYPHQFSGGMRQRAMIAMALSCNPDILIADEPTTALDVTIQAQIIELVKGLREEIGMAVIWITHDLGIIAGIAERVKVMYAGFIVESATVKDLYAHPSHPYTLGLLHSVPRVDAGRKERLIPIEGLPPDLLALPPGCPFYPRCSFAIERCTRRRPELRSVGREHEMACWVDVAHEAKEEMVEVPMWRK